MRPTPDLLGTRTVGMAGFSTREVAYRKVALTPLRLSLNLRIFARPSCLFEGVEIAVGAADVDDASGNHGRRQECPYGVSLGDANDHVIVEIGLEDSFVVWLAVGFGKRSEVLARAFRLKGPSGLEGCEIDGDQFAILSGKVERGASDGR